MIKDSIIDLVGNTPLVRLHKIEEYFNLSVEIYAKLEKNNPVGSIKDRPVLEMLKGYQEKGLIKEGSTIIEATSGNTGIALAALGNYFNYHIIIVMPSSMSEQRKALIRAYGAELVLVEQGGMKGANEKALELQKEIPGSIIFGQFDNLDNPKAHYLHTAREIEEDIPDLDYLFAGFGTGGTISGIARYFKEKEKATKFIGVEPASSPLLSENKAGPHKIQGIGANFIPNTLDTKLIDEVVTCLDDDAINMAKLICKKEGLLVGISSGAALASAISYINKNNLKNKKVVVILPDTGERYSWN